MVSMLTNGGYSVDLWARPRASAGAGTCAFDFDIGMKHYYLSLLLRRDDALLCCRGPQQRMRFSLPTYGISYAFRINNSTLSMAGVCTEGGLPLVDVANLSICCFANLALVGARYSAP
jgi:hypothetical protein